MRKPRQRNGKQRDFGRVETWEESPVVVGQEDKRPGAYHVANNFDSDTTVTTPDSKFSTTVL